MLFWFLLGALFIGSVAFTVSYVITKNNIVETIINAIKSRIAQNALQSGVEALIKERGENSIKLDVLLNTIEGDTEKMSVEINAAGVDSDIVKGMKIAIV